MFDVCLSLCVFQTNIPVTHVKYSMEWTERYRPKQLSEVQGNTDAINQLRKWADNWENEKTGVILHGRPGLGKTTSAHALANDKGWDTIEMNASEQRTKHVVEKIAGGAANMGTLTAGVDGKRLVILDEADSLHGNVDRGGTGAMTSVVKNASQPVILIANDFYDMSNGLRNACETIEFDLVNKSVITNHLKNICEKEDIKYTTDALNAIADKANGDMRAAVNDLQAVASHTNSTLTVDDLPTQQRDRKENIFSFMDTLFKTGEPKEAYASAMLVDETPDNLFQWIEDNVIQEYSGLELKDAYTALARSDEWLGRVYSSDHNYKYWRYANDQMTASVANSRRGHHGGWTRWGPPSFWMKLGRTRGTRNRRDEIAQRIGEESATSIKTAKDDVLPYLKEITHHCKNRELTVAMAALYNLNEKEISFITGSGESTNKVESIVKDADELQAEKVSKHLPDSLSSTQNSTTDQTNTREKLTDTDTKQSKQTSDKTQNTSAADDDGGTTQSTLF